MTVSHPSLSHPKYRPDIDGLRAIAVLAVVAFHAFPFWISGGFIGVDVFFVISGFLISTIIFESLEKGTFSFSEFYARRIKRIFPALIIVLIASFAFGWFALLADEYQQLGKHIAGGAGFISNLVLWGEAGYFDNSAETKPLLHLWSLGIEEQFYMAWPLLLWFARKRNFNLLTVTVFVAVVSFALNVKGVKTNPVATFYSPQTRFWELLGGSFLAWITLYKSDALSVLKIKLDTVMVCALYREKPVVDGRTLCNVLSFVGLFALVYGFWRINKDFSFPGKWAVLPVLGAILIIFSGQNAWVNRNILSNKILVWFGLISFPLYLWHWPLLAFARIVESDTLSREIRIAAVLISIFLAWLTYRLVERPIRGGNHDRAKVAVLALLMIGVACTGYATYSNEGLKSRAAVRLGVENNELLDWHSFKTDGCEGVLKSNTNFCLQLGNPNNQKIAIIGDSTGNALAPGLAKIYESHNAGLVNFGSYGCPPIRGIIATEAWANANDCVEGIRNAFRVVLESKSIDTVVLAIFTRDLKTWGGYPLNVSLDEKFNQMKLLMDKDILDLQSAGKKVIVTYDAPYNPKQARDCLERPFTLTPSRKCEVTEDQIIDRQPYLDFFDKYFSNKNDVCVVKQSNVLVKGGMSQFFDGKGKLLLRDTHHLSYHGSDVIADEFVKSGCVKIL
ncbi:acyltransferase family protein [Pseudomonas fluorescens]|uniref:Acyltransferase n=1 Tax=Pseudomonas fluorescens TaxID=294 RepID=A0A5E7LAX8_PSEFL|nr:acyltransferase family protein [Pseudomonas fluorescens]VVP11320.1 hypothetical protein PS854_03313 [Pseudomonas fluorescens]